jgi:hypothetical protein
MIPICGLLLASTGCAASAGNSASVYAGAYPVVSPMASPTDPDLVWTPTGKPLGPLKAYSGKGSKVIGTTVDKTMGLSYAKLGKPWHDKGTGQDSAGQDYDFRKPVYTWLGGVYSGPLRDKFIPAVQAAGANRLRAAAELSAKNIIFDSEEKLTPIAGGPLKISGHKAWLAGYLLTIPDPYNSVSERTMIEIAVDTGRANPSMLQIALAKNSYRLRPDITTVIKSLKVIK